jgi:esterase/lipase
MHAPECTPLTENTFAAALSEIDALAAVERADPAIDPRCVSFALHHGAATQRAIVLLHGFTNCPRQFAPFAQLLFERGFNVYVPRLPRHGMLDKLTTELAGLTADELAMCGARATRLAGGLAARTSVLGLSVGATLAAWLAQTEPLDRVVAVSPFFSVVRVPSLLEPALAGALELAPNTQLWWDPRAKAELGPAHAYPRFPTHALAQCLNLGQRVFSAARERAPRAARNVLVLNANDPAVDNGAARNVWSAWERHGGPTEQYTFENLDARHDIIEPTTFPSAPDLVYPVLLQLLER